MQSVPRFFSLFLVIGLIVPTFQTWWMFDWDQWRPHRGGSDRGRRPPWNFREPSTLRPIDGRLGGCPSFVTCEPAIGMQCPSEQENSFCGSGSICCPHSRRPELSCCIPTFAGRVSDATPSPQTFGTEFTSGGTNTGSEATNAGTVSDLTNEPSTEPSRSGTDTSTENQSNSGGTSNAITGGTPNAFSGRDITNQSPNTNDGTNTGGTTNPGGSTVSGSGNTVTTPEIATENPNTNDGTASGGSSISQNTNDGTVSGITTESSSGTNDFTDSTRG